MADMQDSANPDDYRGTSSTSTEADLLSRDEKRARGWKFQGYREFTKWMGSSDDFCLVRRFSRSGIRVLLRLQDEITELEEELEKLDVISMEDTTDCGRLDSFRIDHQHFLERDELMRKLTKHLKEYYDFVAAFSMIKSREDAQYHQVRNVKNCLHNNKYSIDPAESAFIEVEGDLKALVARPKSLLRQGLEELSLLRRVFRLGPRQDRIENETTTYFSDRWFDFASDAAVIFAGVALLLGPIWGLELMQNSTSRLTIITVFVIIFAVHLLCSTTNARQTTGFEVIAATAAYAAFLAILLQANGPN